MTTPINHDLMLSSVTQRDIKVGKDILGKDDFLKLLMTQLQNQDPMNPMNDQDFIEQMATFSSLEQMSNMSQSIDQLVQMELQNSLINYHQFVGQDVTWHKMTENDEVINGKGTIQSVQFLKDTVQFILEDGTELAPANISETHRHAKESTIVQASGMIGKKITWVDDEEVSGIVQSVSVKNGVIHFQTKEGLTVKPDQLVKVSG